MALTVERVRELLDYDRATGVFNAYIKINGRGKNLGYFKSKYDAHAAYCVAAISAFGEFARNS